MKTLIDAARKIVAAYEAMPDVDLGRGLTNGDFFALRDAVQIFEQAKNDTPTSHLRNALQASTLLTGEVANSPILDRETIVESLITIEARILAALEQLEGKPL